MLASTANVNSRASVRWPFRFIAAAICVAGMTAVFAALLQAWCGDTTSLQLKGLIALPAVSMMIRFAYHAAVRGRAPTMHFWPFASGRVAFWYFVVLVCTSHIR
jgi:hypothetical protein